MVRNIRGKNCHSVIVLHGYNHFIFDVYLHYIEWNIARIIWIGFHKNENNDTCLIQQLPKDLVKYILSLLGRVLASNDASITPYIKI